MKVLKSLDSIRVQYDAVVKAIAELKVQQKALKKAGIDYGTPNYKEGKYLHLPPHVLSKVCNQVLVVMATE